MNNDKAARSKELITIIGPSAGQTRRRERDILERTLEVDKVRESFVYFLNGLKKIIDVKVPAVGDFELDEFQFRAEITADGDFKLLGTGIGIEATSGVTFTLRRRKEISNS